MRCKPGDLAIVVNDIEMPQNNGALVRVLCRARPENYLNMQAEWDCEALSTIRIDGYPSILPGGTGFGYRDRELRPLRPDDGQDETLTWRPIYEPA